MAKAVKQVRGKFADEKYLGSEPILKDGCTESEVGKAFTWFNYFYTSEDAKRFLITFLKEVKFDKAKIKRLEKVNDWHLTTIGWIARLLSNGSKLPRPVAEKVFTKINDILKSTVEKEETEKLPEKVVDIQKRVAEKTSEYIGDLEIIIDDFMKTGNSNVNFANWLRDKGIKPMIAAKIAEFYKPLYDELYKAAAGDKAVLEGYEGAKKPYLKKYLEFIKGLVAACEGANQVIKKERKPRKRKAKPVSAIVAKVKYLAKDDATGLVSVAPTEIVGASQLWVYNTKYRKLYVYNASAASGLSVKGTTLIGFDEKSSFGKTLRKPKEKLDELKNAGKVALRKFMDTIKATQAIATGRLNTECVLVKVVK